MIRNVKLAAERNRPVCRSPGYPVVYVRIGRSIVLNADIQKVFQRVIIEAKKSYLRPSIVHLIIRRNPEITLE